MPAELLVSYAGKLLSDLLMIFTVIIMFLFYFEWIFSF